MTFRRGFKGNIMTGCPDEDCKTNLKEKITGHHTTLYGNDGTGGLSALPKQLDMLCKTKVSNIKFYSVVGLIVCVLVGGFFSFMRPIWDRKDSIDAKQFEKISLCDITTGKMQVTITGIEDDLKDIKATQKEMARTQVTKDDLREILKDVLDKR